MTIFNSLITFFDDISPAITTLEGLQGNNAKVFQGKLEILLISKQAQVNITFSQTF